MIKDGTDIVGGIMDTKSPPILVPIINKIIPSILAQEIIGVQPMSASIGFGKPKVHFTCEDYEFGKKILHIHFDVFGVLGEGQELLDQIENYINETFGSRVSKTNGLNYIFNNEEDLTMFLLRWS